jgi:hypothetical protein
VAALAGEEVTQMSTLADLLVKIGVDNSGVDKGTKQTESKFEKTWGRVKATAAVAGAAIGLAVATSAVQALDVEAASDKLSAQLGATADEAGRFGKVAGDLYSGAYGESIAQVNDAVGSVVTSIDGMRSASSDALQDMTAKALDFATTFEVDVSRATQVAGQAVSSGLAKDATQAMDLLTVSMQRVPTAVREDILDAVDEYGPFMASIGLQGEKAFGLLVKGAEKGMFGIDKTGDALKEFTLLATDMSAASKAGYDAIGLSQEDMSRKLTIGGEQGAKAFEQIVSGLLKIKDPLEQQQAALALFGTPLEDLAVTDIPKFLASLDATSGGLGKVAGAADEMGKTLNDNSKTELTAFKREAEAALVGVLSSAVPHLRDAATYLKENASWVKPLAIGLGILAVVIGTIVVITKIWTAVQTALNIVMAMNPLGLIIFAVIALIAIIVLIATKTTWFQTIWEAVWGAIKAAAEFVFNWIVGGWKFVFNTVVAILKLWWTVFSGFWTKVGQIAASTWKWITDKIVGFVGFVKGLPGKIANAAKGMWNGIVKAFKSAINTLIRLWNNFSLTLGGGSVLGIDVPSITLNTPNIPYLAEGGIVPASPGGTLALLGEGRHDEAVVPLPRGASQLDGGSGGGTLTLNFTGATGNPMAVWLAKSVRNGDVQLIDSAGRRVRVAGG